MIPFETLTHLSTHMCQETDAWRGVQSTVNCGLLLGDGIHHYFYFFNLNFSVSYENILNDCM